MQLIIYFACTIIKILMNNPPNYLDGAKVIKCAWSGQKPFGFIANTDNKSQEEVFGFAICRYENSNNFYRFSCDKNWEVIQDAQYNSIEEAIELLPDQYKNVECNWQAK